MNSDRFWALVTSVAVDLLKLYEYTFIPSVSLWTISPLSSARAALEAIVTNASTRAVRSLERLMGCKVLGRATSGPSEVMSLRTDSVFVDRQVPELTDSGSI